MPLMLSEVYDALLEAGASDEKARSAATAIAGYENRLISIEAKVDRLEARLSALDTKVTWMFGVVTMIVGGILWKVW